MRRLIVNADDFGQSPGVSDGIVRAHREGVVTSTTIMANGAAFDHAARLALETPTLGVGVHLNLVEGFSVSAPDDVRSLLDDDGRLLSKYALVARHLARRLKLEELGAEVDAQLDRVSRAGIAPTHVDAHKNIHAYPAFFDVVAGAAAERGIRCIRFPYERLGPGQLCRHPRGALRAALLNTAAAMSRQRLKRSRLVTTDAFAGTLRTGAVSAAWLAEWIASLSAPTTELMVHPGVCDEALVATGARLTLQREAEMQALMDAGVRSAVISAGVELIHYGQLGSRPNTVC